MVELSYIVFIDYDFVFSFKAELLTDSLGDLCHTKASLRLDLVSPSTKLIPSTPLDPHIVQLSSKDFLKPIPDPPTLSSFEDDELHSDVQHKGIPSSCTGSMDSLSSSSGSERQVSFTTFGKAANSQQTSPKQRTDPNVTLTRTNSNGGLIFIDNVEHLDPLCSPPHSLRTSSLFDTISLPFDGPISLTSVDANGKPQQTQQQQQNDSTDEDSGIESIKRIKSTTPPLSTSTKITEQSTTY